MPRCLPAPFRSFATWTHNSRVGTTTSTCGVPSPGTSTRCSSGTPKPSVLPMPVRAWPIRSSPAMASGRVSSWMANVRSMPASASARTISGLTPNSAKVGASGVTGAPACSGCEVSSAAGPFSLCSRATAAVFSVVEISAVRVIASLVTSAHRPVCHSTLDRGLGLAPSGDVGAVHPGMPLEACTHNLRRTPAALVAPVARLVPAARRRAEALSISSAVYLVRSFSTVPGAPGPGGIGLFPMAGARSAIPSSP